MSDNFVINNFDDVNFDKLIDDTQEVVIDFNEHTIRFKNSKLTFAHRINLNKFESTKSDIISSLIACALDYNISDDKPIRVVQKQIIAAAINKHQKLMDALVGLEGGRRNFSFRSYRDHLVSEVISSILTLHPFITIKSGPNFIRCIHEMVEDEYQRQYKQNSIRR